MNDAIDQAMEMMDTEETPISELELQDMMQGMNMEQVAHSANQGRINHIIDIMRKQNSPAAMSEIMNQLVTDGVISPVSMTDGWLGIEATEESITVTHKVEVIIGNDNLNQNATMMARLINAEIAKISQTVAGNLTDATDDEIAEEVVREKDKYLDSMAGKIRAEMRAGALQNESCMDAIITVLICLEDDEFGMINRIFQNVEVSMGEDGGPQVFGLKGRLSGSALTNHHTGHEIGGYTIFSNIESLAVDVGRDAENMTATMVFTNHIRAIQANAGTYSHQNAMDHASKAMEEGEVRLVYCSLPGVFSGKHILTGFSGKRCNYMLLDIVSGHNEITDAINGDLDMDGSEPEDIQQYLRLVDIESSNGMFATVSDPEEDHTNLNIKYDGGAWIDGQGVRRHSFGCEVHTISPIEIGDNPVMFDVNMHGTVRNDGEGHSAFILIHQPRL